MGHREPLVTINVIFSTLYHFFQFPLVSYSIIKCNTQIIVIAVT